MNSRDHPLSASTYKTNTFAGILAMIAIVPTAPLSRQWYNRLGATPEECRRALPDIQS
jgi:hypothetical protein